jgi:hypothetical protein
MARDGCCFNIVLRIFEVTQWEHNNFKCQSIYWNGFNYL